MDQMKTGPESIVEIVGLHKRFGDKEILKNVELRVQQGEAVAIIGPSGSGKTTLLRCINFLEEYESGEVRIGGQLVGYKMRNGRRARLSERELALQRADIGMVFQSFNLFPHLTVEENILLGLTRVRKKPLKEAREISGFWLERVGVADKKRAYPTQLSGGQQQRVAIARAVAMGPKVMLFDEVTSALDPELVGEVLLVMQDLVTSGMTMLIVSHEMPFVREVAQVVVFMDEGEIIERGSASKTLMNPQSERLETFLARFRGVFG